MNGLVKKGHDRSALCKAMAELEAMNFLRQRGKGWLLVHINPRVVRPFWRKDKLLKRSQELYDLGVAKINTEDEDACV